MALKIRRQMIDADGKRDDQFEMTVDGKPLFPDEGELFVTNLNIRFDLTETVLFLELATYGLVEVESQKLSDLFANVMEIDRKAKPVDELIETAVFS